MKNLLRLTSITALILFLFSMVVFLCGPEVLPYPGGVMKQWLKILATKPPLLHKNFLKKRVEEWRETFSFAPCPEALETMRLKLITTNEDSETYQFETPILYDLLDRLSFLVGDHGKGTNGSIRIVCYDGDGFPNSTQWVSRTSNGNCLITFCPFNVPNGTYHVKLELSMYGKFSRGLTFRTTGQPVDLVISHPPDICHIDWSMSDLHFKGVILYARLDASDATYTIELQTTNGASIKTIMGRTTNGIINERWDLTNEHGAKYTNSTVNAVYHVTLTNSLSQTKTQFYNIESQ